MNILHVILTFCLLSSVAIAHIDGHDEMCQHLSYLGDFYNLQCAINQKIATETDARLMEMKENYNKLEQQLDSTKVSLKAAEAKLDNLLEKFSRMEQKPTPAISVETVSNCDLKYNGKCFRAILHDTSDVNFAAAETMCYNGWKLANIYSRNHCDEIAKYLKTKVAPLTWYGVWLGMAYDVNARQMYLSDGTRFTEEIPWFSTFPDSRTSHYKIGIYIEKDSTRQGVINVSPTRSMRGVLCEI